MCYEDSNFHNGCRIIDLKSLFNKQMRKLRPRERRRYTVTGRARTMRQFLAQKPSRLTTMASLVSEEEKDLGPVLDGYNMHSV